MPDYVFRKEIVHGDEVIAMIIKDTITITYKSISMFGRLGEEEKLRIPLFHSPITFEENNDNLAAIRSNGNRIMLKTEYDTPRSDDFDRMLELYNILRLKYKKITNTVFDNRDITDGSSDIYVDDLSSKSVNDGMIKIFEINVKVDDSLVEQSKAALKCGNREVVTIDDVVESKNYNIIARNIIHMLSN